MEIKQLLYFKRTAELEHMTRAAEELLISQPYLSRTIASLEGELGVKLFDHVGRRIVLNPCGHAFYKRVVNMFNEAEDAKREVQDIYRSQQTRLTIVTNVGLYMPGLLNLLSAANPELKIRQLSMDRRSMIHMLLNGEADFAVCCPPLDESVEFITEHLRYEPGVIIYPDGHWLKDFDEVGFEEIKDETFITVAQGFGSRDAFDAYFKKLGLMPKVSIESGDTSSVFMYVRSGLGISPIPLSMVLREGSFKNSFTYFKDNAGADIALTWRRHQYISEAGEQFMKKAKEYFSSLSSYVTEQLANQ